MDARFMHREQAQREAYAAEYLLARHAEDPITRRPPKQAAGR